MAVQLEIPYPRTHQKDVIEEMATKWGVYGITVAEVRERLGLHHGSASSALSALEKEGRLVRLVQRREKCSVYVVPESVHGSPVAVPRAHRGPTQEEVERAFQQGRHNGAEDALRQAQTFALRTREAVLRSGGTKVKRHDAGCYREHPECALKAVMKFIQNSLDLNEEARRAQQEATRTTE